MGEGEKRFRKGVQTLLKLPSKTGHRVLRNSGHLIVRPFKSNGGGIYIASRNTNFPLGLVFTDSRIKDSERLTRTETSLEYQE